MLVQIATFVSNSLPAQTSIVAIVLESVLRLVPSQKPLSIIYGIGSALDQLAKIFSGIAAFTDKVLPQNISK